MTRTAKTIITLAVLLLLVSVGVSFLIARADRRELHDQAVLELVQLDLPAAWGKPAIKVGEPAGQRHAGIVVRYPDRGDPAAMTAVAGLAREQGWSSRNCGTEVCMEKGLYFLQTEAQPCTADPARCELAVTINWNAPLLAGRMLAIATFLIAVIAAVLLVITRRRPSPDTGRANTIAERSAAELR
ncbi:hypothetical protein AB0M43_14725 [Longispora sp. NPDC051575]|uniref:hypothetical protein n=1 Tax=Longispora sp. NPDC051575 TaxID=3154943 RepID=UPI0034259EC8